MRGAGDEKGDAGRRDAVAAASPDGPAPAPWLLRLASAFRLHLAGFLVVNTCLAVANWLTGGGWWTFWPLLVTAFALGLHFLVHKALTVDETWAAARSEELHLKSYDRGHIQSIAERGGLATPVDEKLRPR